MPLYESKPIEIISFKNFKQGEGLLKDLHLPLTYSNNFNYLVNYLTNLGCSHCLIENDYISMSFWYDYANFYAGQTQNYTKYSKRVHFFKSEDSTNFNSESFYDFYIKGKNDLPEYLGNVVLKNVPNPDSALGVIMLETYPTEIRKKENEFRYYPCTRNYSVNLYGKKIEITTLITQSQDSVSACATIALFTTISLLSELYTTAKLFPSQITKIAFRKYPNELRALPSKEGLDIKQVVGILRDLRLTHELIPLNKEKVKKNVKISNFKGVIYAYSSSCKIPVLVMVDRFNTVPEKDEKGELHLVVNSGFKIDYSKESSSDFPLFSDRLIRALSSDDNLGPFASVEISEDIEDKHDLKIKNNDNKSFTYDNLRTLIVPLERSVIVNYETILQYTHSVHTIIEKLVKDEVADGFCWEIFLSLSNDYKSKLIGNPYFLDEEKKEIITSSLPKYIFVVRFAKKSINIATNSEQTGTWCEFIFDTTVFPESDYFCRAMLLNKGFDVNGLSKYVNNVYEGIVEAQKDAKNRIKLNTGYFLKQHLDAKILKKDKS